MTATTIQGLFAKPVDRPIDGVIKADDERMQNYAMGKVWARSFVGVIGFGVPPFANATLDVTMVCERCACASGRACKFKILSVVAC